MIGNKYCVEYAYTVVYLRTSCVCFQSLKNDSNEVKQVAAQLLAYISCCTHESLDEGSLRVVLPALLMGVREKNTIVRSNSELALVETLKLRQEDNHVLQVTWLLPKLFMRSV